MFETITLSQLQHYWWILTSLLGGLLVFMLFVQGGQTFIKTLSQNEDEKTLLINSLGRKWELTFTTLVTFGGAMFAAFPLFYSTSFSGAYWVWLLILLSFILQAVSFEFRKKPNNFFGTKRYDNFLFFNGIIATLLLGTAVSTFFTGSPFFVNNMNQSFWKSSLRGLEAAVNVNNLILGIVVLFLARVLGLLYFINNINNEKIYSRAVKELKWNSLIFLITFIYYTAFLLLTSGFAVDPSTKIVFFESNKYLHNFIQMPIILIVFLIGVVMVLAGIAVSLLKKSKRGIWFSGIGTIFTVFALFIIAGFNNTSFYPSTFDLQSSLTIENASSSKYTLTIMSYVSLIIPIVFGYIFYVWRVMDKKEISTEEIQNEEHLY